MRRKKLCVTTILRLSVCLIFLGRAYQYLFFDAPFRALLWDQNLLKPIVEALSGMTWHQYATSPKINSIIQWTIKANGILFFVAACSACFVNLKNIRFLKYPLLLGTFFLLLMALLEMKEKFYHFAQFFEHSIQVGLPLLLVSFYWQKLEWRKLYRWLRILIACTFFAHGLYALGVYPVPGHFIDMTILSLGIKEDSACIFLYAAGLLDVLISILILIPNRHNSHKIALAYAFFWGLVTAFARVFSGFDSNMIFYSLHQTIYLTVYRLAHGLVPLAAFLLISNNYYKSQS